MPGSTVYNLWQTRGVNNRWILQASNAVSRVLSRRVLHLLSEPIVDRYVDSHPDVERALASNLRGAFPDDSRMDFRAAGRRTVLNYARGVIDFLRADRDPPEIVCDDAEGVELMRRNEAKILLTAHMGNWEIGGCMIGGMGGDHWVLAFPEKDPGVDRFRVQKRSLAGLETLQRNGRIADLFRLRKIIGEGGSVILLVDRAIGKDRVRVRFRGRDCCFLRSPALLSAMTGAPMLPVAIMAEAPGRYRGHIGRPVSADPEDPSAAMQSMADFFGGILERYPDQWYNFFPFWEDRA